MAQVNPANGPGMGRPSGPDFAGPPLPGTPAGLGQPYLGGGGSAGPRPPAPQPPAPPPNRLPIVLTVLAIALVALVVVIASVWAWRQDAQPAPTQPTPSQAASASRPPANRIEFTTSTGSGVLEIVDHSWDSAQLTLEVKVTCNSGTLRYGPDSFQAFDGHGTLFEATYDPDSSTALEFVRLSAGQQVSGTVTFEIPRGDVTLLLSDELSRTITALKVPD